MRFFELLRAQKMYASQFVFGKMQCFGVKNAHGSLFLCLGSLRQRSIFKLFFVIFCAEWKFQWRSILRNRVPIRRWRSLARRWLRPAVGYAATATVRAVKWRKPPLHRILEPTARFVCFWICFTLFWICFVPILVQYLCYIDFTQINTILRWWNKIEVVNAIIVCYY